MDTFSMDFEAPTHGAAQSLTLMNYRARIWILISLTSELEIDVIPNVIMTSPSLYIKQRCLSCAISGGLGGSIGLYFAEMTFVGEHLYLAFCSPDPHWGISPRLTFFGSNYMAFVSADNRIMSINHFKKWFQRWHFSSAERAF